MRVHAVTHQRLGSSASTCGEEQHTMLGRKSREQRFSSCMFSRSPARTGPPARGAGIPTVAEEAEDDYLSGDDEGDDDEYFSGDDEDEGSYDDGEDDGGSPAMRLTGSYRAPSDKPLPVDVWRAKNVVTQEMKTVCVWRAGLFSLHVNPRKR
jgi:hypothetical protein